MRFIFAALISFVFAGSALAQSLVDATKPQRILQAAQKVGTAQLVKDKEGDPLIEGTADGQNYVIFFYGCDKGAACKEVVFFALFEPSDKLGRADRIARCNQFNSARRFGRAFVTDKNDYGVDYAVTLAGGVSPANLDDTFDWWRVVMADFRDKVVDGKLATSVSLPSLDAEGGRNATTKFIEK